MSVPAVILGASGYVAGELLRILAGHPDFRIAGAISESNAGKPVESVFSNLTGIWPEFRFRPFSELAEVLEERCAVFSCAPHGASAGLIAAALKVADEQDVRVRIVDASADFRFADADAYEQVYGAVHGAPELLPSFSCALPEHRPAAATRHIGHPGCFASALLLASVPLMRHGLTATPLFASGVTGSTGAGKQPLPTTHHPVRHSNMFAYRPLKHRHAPEVEAVCEAVSGVRPDLRFVPHSGPFARGIYITMQAGLEGSVGAERIREAFADTYAEAPFVHVIDRPPKLKDVVGGNHAHIGVTADRGSVAVFVVLDNLVKGAAGGAVQWMNRLYGLEETAGLAAAGPAWT
ncbi:MAG: N-acetyl-gamma-glutamyl-phosphate reductase [Gammaproteobacteria bacterium]|nr:N-acetyl-gamma-glutamyl-phosphate reductase [Gammaproteobacteria bacterium]